MFDYAALAAVAAVVREGSFDKAAQTLHVTPSAVSQRIKQLEERMGAVLIVRGQPCVATETGLRLCRHMEQVGLLEHALLGHLPGVASQGGQPPATLHVATNADSLGTWFLEAAARFTQATGHLLDIAVDDQDHTGDWLRRGEVLAAVTAAGAPVQGCVVRELGALRYHATASPAFVARHFPNGVSVEALGQSPALLFNRKDKLQHQWTEQVFGHHLSLPAHRVPSTHGFVDACLLGMGWGLNPAPLVAGHLAAGRLVELVPGAALDVPLFWQANRMAAPLLAQLTQEIVAAANAYLVHAGPKNG